MALLLFVRRLLESKRGTVLVYGALSVLCLAAIAFGRIEPKERVTSLDLAQVFPIIRDYNEGRTSKVLEAGEYMAGSSRHDCLVEIEGRWLSIECSLNDSGIEHLRNGKKGEVSESIGDEAFFWNYWEQPHFLKLVYRRKNVVLHIQAAHQGRVENGRWITAPAADQRRAEEIARLMDAAIEKRGPGISFQKLGRFELASYNVQRFVGGIIFLVLIALNGGRIT